MIQWVTERFVDFHDTSGPAQGLRELAYGTSGKAVSRLVIKGLTDETYCLAWIKCKRHEFSYEREAVDRAPWIRR
ncbi:hypothetical protein SAMN05192543_11568 [Paraburkholderia megapolitana]|uniref:Uncharacterized protein n=1 Tax=Paraburkholderia megapolitana TaxID=420953 RepID=A0A1I3W006_9BURK|nr:hypothetical protein SAMN05192543_11568 [Paraburkholderia megapolitana]